MNIAQLVPKAEPVGGTARRSSLTAFAAGAVGGLYGAAAMSVLRLYARRIGLIDEMVPEFIEQWLLGDAATGSAEDNARRHVSHQALHLAYGAGWGALAGPSLAKLRRGTLLPGVGLGLALWAVGLVGLLPRHRTGGGKSWEATAPAQTVNVLAHALFGIAVQLAAQEVWRSPRRERRSRIG
jgi:hypothetical protein